MRAHRQAATSGSADALSLAIPRDPKPPQGKTHGRARRLRGVTGMAPSIARASIVNFVNLHFQAALLEQSRRANNPRMKAAGGTRAIVSTEGIEM
jgi:hypothetical protein